MDTLGKLPRRCGNDAEPGDGRMVSACDNHIYRAVALSHKATEAEVRYGHSCKQPLRKWPPCMIRKALYDTALDRYECRTLACVRTA